MPLVSLSLSLFPSLSFFLSLSLSPSLPPSPSLSYTHTILPCDGRWYRYAQQCKPSTHWASSYVYYSLSLSLSLPPSLSLYLSLSLSRSRSPSPSLSLSLSLHPSLSLFSDPLPTFPSIQLRSLYCFSSQRRLFRPLAFHLAPTCLLVHSPDSTLFVRL